MSSTFQNGSSAMMEEARQDLPNSLPHTVCEYCFKIPKKPMPKRCAEYCNEDTNST